MSLFTLLSLHLIMSSLAVMFFRFVTSGEIQRRAEFFEPFISGLTNSTVAQVSLLVLFFVFVCNARTKDILPVIMCMPLVNTCQ